MTSRIVLIFVVGLLLAAGGWWIVLRQQTPEPAPAVPTLRLTSGGLGRFQNGQGTYAPLAAGSEIKPDEPLMSDESTDVRLRLSSGGTIVAGPHTALTVEGATAGALRLRLDDGHLWLHLKGEERVMVSSFHSLLTASRGDCEIRVYQDKDHFENTVMMMWRGNGRVRGGERLELERPLPAGVTEHIDDARVFPLSRFELARPDNWQKQRLLEP